MVGEPLAFIQKVPGLKPVYENFVSIKTETFTNDHTILLLHDDLLQIHVLYIVSSH